MLGDIEKSGGALIAISPELPGAGRVTTEKNQLTFDVLSDSGNKVAAAYGLVFQVPPDLREFYKTLGIDLAKHNGDAGDRLPLPATFVIDRTGVIRAAFADADYVKRMEPAAIVAALTALR